MLYYKGYVNKITTMISQKCQLIVYPDSLGKNLSELNTILDTYLVDIVYGVHILPFYPSSADRGFSPLTYNVVDNQFGNWEDIHSIASKFEIMADFMLNHISSQSIYFQDYLQYGQDSAYADMFLDTKKITPDGIIPP